MKVKILNSYPLIVPAVSGMDFYNGNLYLISDNANEISVCNQKGKLLRVLHSKNLKINEIAKKDKSDFEGSTLISYNGQPFLLVIGSGSTILNRNKARLFSLNSEVELGFDLLPFYDFICAKFLIDKENWNIEALASFNQNLYFFNRGTNSFFEIKQADFFDFIEQKKTDVKVNKYELNIGKLSGFNLGISGVTVDKDGFFYCTASAENTSDWYNDGEIIGSAIGSFSGVDLKETTEVAFTPFLVNNKLVLTKLEAICESDRPNRFFVASDNDGKESELFEIELLR